MLSSLIDTRALEKRRGGRSQRAAVDAAALERDLRTALRGEIRFDDASRALYATDASNYRQVPIGVVIPESRDDVIRAVAVCRAHGAPVLPRGGGTSLCGQTCNVAVVIDFSKRLDKILHLDPNERHAVVEPGVVLDNLRDAAERHGLTFGPDPSTHNHNTLGGMIGNNSCGVHSVMAGETVDNVIELEVLTYDGEILRLGPTDDAQYARVQAAGGRAAEIQRGLRELRDAYAADIRAKFPPIPRRVSGYNLPALLPENGFNLARAVVGSEGTCLVVLSAKLRLVPSPPGRSLLVLGYPSVYEAGDHVPEVMRFEPIGLEGIDDRLIADMKAVNLHPRDVDLLPPGQGWLLVEFGGPDREDSHAQAHRAMEALRKSAHPPSMKLFDDAKEEAIIWEVRKSGLGATAHVPEKPITWEGWEDSSVPPQKLGEYLRKLRALLDKYGYACDLYGHFGQGCVHTRIDFDLETAEGIRNFRGFLDEAAHLVVSLGGSISGEHGDGQSKAALLPIMFGERIMRAFLDFKRIWDPGNRMNPGKVVDAYAPDENLRIGSHYAPPAVESPFGFPEDHGDFAHAALRCVGVGECRKEAGLMCPSYKVTRDEMHATRGRARLLFEMLRGDPLRGGWRSDAVREALDLCLSCKGCKGECPVHVDMATYKAQFMSRHYAGRLRAPSAYLFGRIDRWARLASHAPRLVNFLASTPPFAPVIKAVAGIHHARRIPAFARRTFLDQARPRAGSHGGPRVMLWADTFNNHYHPQVAIAALRVLESQGCDVVLPPAGLCCGRPLYEFGFLDHARAYLERVMDALKSEIEAGTPLVVLEPACASVFRDELVNLLSRSEQARRLSRQVFLLDEFLADRRGAKLPRFERKAILHGHCHQKSILGMQKHVDLLHGIGVKLDVPDSGCCGMAGSFGFGKSRYDVSIACGERVLLPAVRGAAADTLIIANGFSCREQIAQCTGKRAMHLAEVLALALEEA